MQFLMQVSRRKSEEFCSTAPFFFVLYMIAYQSPLIPRRFPWPKKRLVTRLGWFLLLILFALVNIYLFMEQQQPSSNIKIKKKCRSVLHHVFLAHFKKQTIRSTDDELGVIIQHKLNQVFEYSNNDGENFTQLSPYLVYRGWNTQRYTLYTPFDG